MDANSVLTGTSFTVEYDPAKIAIAAEPRWVEMSREELRLRQNRLAALISRLVNRDKPILSEDEEALLQSLWQMLFDLLD